MFEGEMEPFTQTTKRIPSESNNSRRRRSRIEIAADMLDAAVDGAGKTRIMQNANLSYDLLLKYLSFLTETGLLECTKSNGVYYITSKGSRFLKEFRELQILHNLYIQKLLTLKAVIDQRLHREDHQKSDKYSIMVERKKPFPA